jgi:hypothetical protein
MGRRTIWTSKERAGAAAHPDRHPDPLADLGASFSSGIETDFHLAALVAAFASSPSPETPTRSMDVPGGSSEVDGTSDAAWQGKIIHTWNTRLRRKLLARRRSLL